MVEGGATPVQKAEDLQALGFDIVIFPGGIVRALAKSAAAYYGSLKAHGSNAPFSEQMFDFNGLNDVLGTSDMLAAGRRFEGLGEG